MGDPENPLTWNDVAKKMDRLAGPVLGHRRASELVEEVERVDRVEDVSIFYKLLVP